MNLNKYRDNNNFLKINKVTHTYNRYFVGFDKQESIFLNIIPNAPFVSGKRIINYNYSQNAGKTFDVADF